MAMDMDDAANLLASLKALRIFFMGEGGNAGLVEEIQVLIKELKDAKDDLEESSVSSTKLTKAIMLRLATKVANEATVSALQYEQSRICELVAESLNEVAEKASLKSVERLVESSKSNKKFRELEQANMKLLSRLKKQTIINYGLVFLCLVLLSIIIIMVLTK